MKSALPLPFRTSVQTAQGQPGSPEAIGRCWPLRILVTFSACQRSEPTTMNIHEFSEQQQQALLDLAVLAMYADGHLAAVEDVSVQRLLAAMGHNTDFDRNKQFDAAVARLRRHTESVEAARTHATTLAHGFTTQAARQQAFDTLNGLVASDNQVAPQENSYLAVVRAAFQMRA
jgi:hypothetical protein